MEKHEFKLFLYCKQAASTQADQALYFSATVLCGGISKSSIKVTLAH